MKTTWNEPLSMPFPRNSGASPNIGKVTFDDRTEYVYRIEGSQRIDGHRRGPDEDELPSVDAASITKRKLC